jgi:hypothetical protein
LIQLIFIDPLAAAKNESISERVVSRNPKHGTLNTESGTRNA